MSQSFTNRQMNWVEEFVDQLRELMDEDDDGVSDIKLECYEDLLDFYEEIYSERNLSIRLTEYMEKMGYIKETGTPKERVDFLFGKIEKLMEKPVTMCDEEYHAIKNFWEENETSGLKLSVSKKTLKGNYFSRDTSKETSKKTSYRLEDRNLIFLFCFALELDYEAMKEFFNKVYFERSFCRRGEDIIFHYCIFKGLPYIEALRLLMRLQEYCNHPIEPTQPITAATNVYLQSVESLDECDVLKIASSMLNDSDLKTYKAIQENVKIELNVFIRYHMLKKSAEQPKGKNAEDPGIRETSEILSTLTGFRREEILSKKVDVYSGIRRIVWEEIPSHTRFTNRGVDVIRNFHALRNQLILLHFYNYWKQNDKDASRQDDCWINAVYTNTNTNNNDDSTIKLSNDNYLQEINNTLEMCGLGKMYICNLYDALFIMAARTYEKDEYGDEINPVEAFQCLLRTLFPEYSSAF